MTKDDSQADNGDTLHTISELADAYDVTTRTLRFYENVGLLSPVREGRKRLYNRRDCTRLKLALRGRRLGMTLAEIKEVFDLYDSSWGETAQIERYLEILQEKRAQLLGQQRDLEAALEEMNISERRCRRILDAGRHDKNKR